MFTIQFKAHHFKNLIHRQGIDWICSINYGDYVNVSNQKEYEQWYEKKAEINVNLELGLWIEDVYPDTDFCLWKNFPFYQMVEIEKYDFQKIKNAGRKLTCLYLWLNHYNYKYYTTVNASYVCDYDSFLRLCDKSDYKASFFWSISDTRWFSKGVQIFLAVSSYFVNLFGLITNSILVYLIWNKTAKDIFKDLKHYQYLGMIAIFNLIILTIDILSWLSDCKKTLKLFCPETRRFIALQFFKVGFSFFILIRDSLLYKYYKESNFLKFFYI